MPSLVQQLWALTINMASYGATVVFHDNRLCCCFDAQSVNGKVEVDYQSYLTRPSLIRYVDWFGSYRDVEVRPPGGATLSGRAGFSGNFGGGEGILEKILDRMDSPL